VKCHNQAYGLGDPVEQVLSDLQEAVEDKIGRTQAQLEVALESKEKVIFHL